MINENYDKELLQKSLEIEIKLKSFSIYLKKTKKNFLQKNGTLKTKIFIEVIFQVM